MSVFILGGKAKGLEIFLPTKVSFRPTSVMLRRKLFDKKQRWDDLIFIDLCAGSGAMGFEALSRGASFIVLNDSSPHQQKILEKAKSAWCEKYPEDVDKILILHQDVLRYVKTLELTSSTWLFFDPPYHDEKLYKSFITLLLQKNIPAAAGVIIELEEKKKQIISWQLELEKFRSNKSYHELQSSERKLLIFEGL
jgi:16S rRNA (guanine966-N2)-methyltransferase